MAVEAPLVKINTDPPEELAKLYHVGPTLAQAIVAKREEHGYFKGPEDLARVEGITPSHASTLAPHIDWRAPAEPEPPKKPEWAGALLALIMMAPLVWLLVSYVLTDVPIALQHQKLGEPWAWRGLWQEASLAGVLVFTIAALLSVGVG